VVACSCPLGDRPTTFDAVTRPFQRKGEVYDCFLGALLHVALPRGLRRWRLRLCASCHRWSMCGSHAASAPSQAGWWTLKSPGNRTSLSASCRACCSVDHVRILGPLSRVLYPLMMVIVVSSTVSCIAATSGLY
jgi:hypothetical protein